MRHWTSEVTVSSGYMQYSQWRSWFRHCATSRKVAVSIPDGVIGIFHWRNPSGHIMDLGSTQLLTEMSTRNISWVIKAAGAYGWQRYHLHVPTVLKLGASNSWNPQGLSRPVMGLLYVSFNRPKTDVAIKLPQAVFSCDPVFISKLLLSSIQVCSFNKATIYCDYTVSDRWMIIW